MKRTFLIFDLARREYFAGSNYRPEFSANVSDARNFDAREDAEKRINDEFDDFGEGGYLSGRALTIVEVFSVEGR